MSRVVHAIALLALLAHAPAASAQLSLRQADSLRARGELTPAESAYRALSTSPREGRTARVAMAEIAEATGRHTEAVQLAEALSDEYAGRGDATWSAEDLVALGRAWVLQGQAHPEAVRQALAAFDAAAARDPANLDAPLRAAELFLSRFNAPDAKAGFAEVARRDPGSARAQLGLARVLIFEGQPGGYEATRQALALDSTFVPAMLQLGRLDLEAERYDSAASTARRALARDPSAVDGWALLGAIAWLHGDSTGFAAARAAAARINPRGAEFLAEVAEAAARHRRYVDAQRFGAEAVSLDPNSTRALAVLATNELRLGQMTAGRRHAEQAFAIDPFNLWQKNTLDLLDILDRYATVESPRFRIIAPPRDSAYLRLYLVPLLEEAYDAFAQRYDYRPPTPVRLELFERHADFSVRTVGLTGLGALGVSFGGLLAMDGPRSRAPGEFNYGSTAWHELAHTFTLGLSGNRVPRWLSEGLSVLEERRTGRGWGADVSAEFLASAKAGRVRGPGELNEGLVRPRYPAEIGFTYYQASLVAEMIEASFGVEALRGLLGAFRDGLDEEKAYQRVLHLSGSALAQRYAAWFEKKFAIPLAAVDAWDGTSPMRGSYVNAMVQGERALAAGNHAEARSAFLRASQLFPGDPAPDGPAWALAMLDSADALSAATRLATITAHNETALAANAAEARFRRRAGDDRGALAALQRLSWIDPQSPVVHLQLAETAERLGEWGTALRERRAIIALGPADIAEARYQLARALDKAGDPAAARREVLRLLEEAPGFEKAQELLLELRATPPSGGRP